jgi:hypothetical protein
MGRHSRNFGWWMLLATSLTWFGCKQVPPRCADQGNTAQQQPAAPQPAAPQPAPPLQIADPPPPMSVSQQLSSLPAEEPAPPLLSREPTSPSVGGKAITGDPADQQPPLEPTRRPSLLPPLPGRMQPVPDSPSGTLPNPAAAPLRALERLAAERLAGTPAFIARLRRREQVDGKQRPEELILFKFRLEPASIYMKWLGNEAKNRELIYVKGQHDDMLHVFLAANDPSGLSANGRRTVMRPDSPSGLGKERYPVCETGVAALIARFGKLVDAVERGDDKVGSVKSLGSVKRPEFDAPVVAVMHLIPPGVDSGLPKGGQRLWYFDATLRFPVLVIAHNAQGQEVEYYCFDNILFPARIEEEEFNPAKLGRH